MPLQIRLLHTSLSILADAFLKISSDRVLICKGNAELGMILARFILLGHFFLFSLFSL